jgi:hypothetical protein
MDRAEMIARAAAPCHECGASVQRVEGRWHRDEDGEWQPAWHTVCPDGHRVAVEPLP